MLKYVGFLMIPMLLGCSFDSSSSAEQTLPTQQNNIDEKIPLVGLYEGTSISRFDISNQHIALKYFKFNPDGSFSFVSLLSAANFKDSLSVPLDSSTKYLNSYEVNGVFSFKGDTLKLSSMRKRLLILGKPLKLSEWEPKSDTSLNIRISYRYLTHEQIIDMYSVDLDGSSFGDNPRIGYVLQNQYTRIGIDTATIQTKYINPI